MPLQTRRKASQRLQSYPILANSKFVAHASNCYTMSHWSNAVKCNGMDTAKHASNIKIRSIIDQDIVDIAGWMPQVALWQRYGLTSEKITTLLQQAIDHWDMVYIVEHQDPKLAIGFAWLIRDSMFGKQPYLKQFGIHPDYEGQGIGKQLINRVEAYCKDFSDHLFLLVSDFNTPAQQFYQRLGFEHIGTVPRYVLADVDELIYHKRLNG